MKVQLSDRIYCAFPTLHELLNDVARNCRWIDRDIELKDLLVVVRCHPKPRKFSGWAFAERASWFRGTRRAHRDGRIALCVGEDVSDHYLARVAAHELRHIGQFHRGLRRTGYLNAEHMSLRASEDDAYEFEDRLLDRMGMRGS